MFDIIPWNQYALIAELSKRFSQFSVQFGKTSLQKILYILQEGYEVQCGYNFTLYTYGPYCTDIMIDLDQVDFLDGVSVRSANKGIGGYEISVGPQNEDIRHKGWQFLEENSKAIEQVAKNFGNMTAKELELRATLLYAAKEAYNEQGSCSWQYLVKTITSIKPKYSPDEVIKAIEEMKEIGLICWVE